MTTKQKSSFFRREDAKNAPTQRSRTTTAEKPKFDRPKFDKPKFDRPQGDKPAFDRPQGDKPAFDRPKFDRPKFDRPQGDKPAFDRPKFDRPKFDRPQGDKPAFDRPQGDKPAFDRPKFDRPKFDRPKFDRPQGDKPAFDRPKFDRPKFDRPQGDKPAFDRPKVARPRTERPVAPRSTESLFTDETPVITKPVGERKPTVSKKAAVAVAAAKPIKDDGMVRLNRFVAQSGICSRREADELIAAGRVAVNGVVVTELGSKVDAEKDSVTYDGKPLKGERLIYILMNKSKDHVTTVEDPHADRTVIDLLRGKVRERVYPIGRLDKNTTGVLLLTNDGDLTRELTHPSFEKRKIYHVFLDKPVEEEHLRALTTGIELEDGLMVADQASYVEKNRKEVGVEIHSGRNRIVRRMFEHFGYKVNKLDRVYFAGFTKEGLRRGFWRELTAPEILKLKSGKYR